MYVFSRFSSAKTHTHTQTPRNINKFATFEAKDSGPERQMESEREREKEREEETRAGHVPLHVKGLKNDDDEDGDDQQPKNEDLNLFLFQL